MEALLNLEPKDPRPYDKLVGEKTGKFKLSPSEVERMILAQWTREWSKEPEETPYNCVETYKFHEKIQSLSKKMLCK